MSSSASDSERLVLSDFLAASAHVYTFRLPKTKPIDFFLHFKGYLEDEKNISFISLLNTNRSNVCKELASATATNEMKLFAIDQYYPVIYKPLYSLTNQSPVEISKQFEFEWRGAFTTIETLMSSYQEIIFEVAMVLHTKAILHSLIAEEYAKNTLTLSNAGQHLMSAAGVMDCLATELLPRWLEKPTNMKVTRPPEVQETICLGLAHLFKSMASRMALCKAFIKEGGTGMTVLAKLSRGVSEDGRKALDIFRNDAMTSGSQPKVHFDLSIYMRYNYDLSIAMANAFLGKSLAEKGEFGKAIGLFSHALSMLSEQSSRKYDVNGTGFPKSSGVLSSVAIPIKGIIANIAAIKQSTERENNLIYFQDVPPPTALPDLPEGINIMKAIEFNPSVMIDGKQDFHVFVHDPLRKGIFSSLFSFGSKPKEEVKDADRVVSSTAESSAAAPVTATAYLHLDGQK